VFVKGVAMVDEDRHGTDWNAAELDAIIADYFAMLGDELTQRPYVKAQHRAALMEMTGRTAPSIEFKHRNISAVLQDMGSPWIWGYKPAPNYQDALYDAVFRFISGHGRVLEQLPIVQPTVPDLHVVFVAAPSVTPRPTRPALERLVRKFDPVERDFRNRQLGKAGEEFVVELERRRLAQEKRDDLARKVRWVAAEDGDGAGFDVLSFDAEARERLIEVKTTNGAAQTPFFLTRNEIAVATERPEHWHLYRVHLFAQQPRIFTARPPLDQALAMSPEVWRAVPRSRAGLDQ